MRKVVLATCLLLSVLSVCAQRTLFSDSTVVSLITCSPGKEVYARFGHTAVRVKDPVNQIDIVFNYGIFDFNTSNFYLKFIKGETDYKLAAYDFVYFLPEYIDRNSMVWEQVLNLTPSERDNLIRALFLNYEPENRLYRYNFIFDNCSTRPRDKILEAVADGEKVKFLLPAQEKTFREWVEVYVGTNTWLKFGIDMIFGAESDKNATRKESMFLPEVLMKEFQAAKIVSKDGNNERPLVSEMNVLVQSLPEAEHTLFILFRPFFVSIILLLLGVLFCIKDKKYHVLYKTFDTIIYVLAGLIGCVVLYLSFFSLHPAVGSNYNILWLNPLFILVAIFQWIKPFRKITFFLQSLNAILLIAVLVVFATSMQYFNVAFVPLVLLLFVRAANYLKIRRKRVLKWHS